MTDSNIRRMADGYTNNTPDSDRPRLENLAAQHDPDNLAQLRDADARMKAAGRKLSPGMQTALGYAEGYAAAAAKINDK